MQKHQINMPVELVIAQRTNRPAVFFDIGQNRNGGVFRIAVTRIDRVGYGVAEIATDKQLISLAQLLVTT